MSPLTHSNISINTILSHNSHDHPINPPTHPINRLYSQNNQITPLYPLHSSYILPPSHIF